MNLQRTRQLRIVLSILFLGAVALPAHAQDGPPPYVRDAVRAVESMLSSDDDASIEAFIDGAMVPSETRDRAVLADKLRSIRSEAGGPWDGISVEGEPDGVRLILVASGNERQVKVELGPDGIRDLRLLEPTQPINLTRENLNAFFDELEADGYAGVVFVELSNEVVLRRPFGMANSELGIPNTLETIFGIGSRPIDFTIAAILLLDQQERLDLDDPITRYFENVPVDKKSITIRHLMTGRSGLPDFFHNGDDWDPDLAWIDRQEAQKRLLSQELLFAPGENEEHSHGAFVLLAAVIERVADQPYYQFIRANFLDPAEMTRTGEYGESRGLTVSDFATGYGHARVGVPNIPPNWGPTSWLVKGSGGMYSTLGDLLKFYDYIRAGKVLDADHSAVFRGQSASLDGSDRGFELFSTFDPDGDNVYVFLNTTRDQSRLRRLFRALESLLR